MPVAAVVVGSLVMDLAFQVPRQPQVGDHVVATAFGAYRGGKGYNEAVALARLGADVTMVGAVGADLHGDGLLASLSDEGIDARRVVQLRGTPTAVAAPLITPDGAVAFVHYPGANARLSPAHCADLPDCDVVLLQGEIPATTSEYVIRSYRRRGIAVHLNPSPPVGNVTAEMLNGATVLTLSLQEAITLSGVRPGTAAVEAARALSHPGLHVAVAPAMGRAAWAAGGDSGEVAVLPPAAEGVVDSTGARDSFVAGLALRLAEGASFGDALAFAAAAARHSASITGAEPSLPSRADVERLVRD